MAVTLTQINTTTDTFQSWISKTNDVIGAMSANVLTVAATTTGGVTSGNAYANGVFAANTMAAVTALRGGTVDTAANLSITSNTVFTGANIATSATWVYLGAAANVTANSENFVVGSNNFIATANTNLRANTLSVTTSGRVGINTGSAAAALDVVGTANFGSGLVTFNGNTSFNSNATLNANTVITANTTIRNGGSNTGYLLLGDQTGGARGINYDGTKYNFLTTNVSISATVLCANVVKVSTANVTIDGVDVAAFKNTYDTRPILRVYDVNGTQVFTM